MQSRRLGEFPLGTLVVNVSGCLLLGLLSGLHVSSQAMTLLGTATLGSYTTFSTWMLETPSPGAGRRVRARLAQRARQPRRWVRGGRARTRDRGCAVSEPGIKLTTYFEERDRSDDRFLADALFDVYERHRMRTSVLLRGASASGSATSCTPIVC